MTNQECSHCGKYFDSPRPYKFCSSTCRDLAYKEENYDTVSYQRLRFDIFTRDDFSCVYCGRSAMVDKVKLHMDHVLPKIKGGPDLKYNLVTACEECNLAKSDLSLKDSIVQVLWDRNEKLNSTL